MGRRILVVEEDREIAEIVRLHLSGVGYEVEGGRRRRGRARATLEAGDRHPGRVFTRAQLLERVWGYGRGGYGHTVNSHINRLRAKIEADPASPRYVRTVWGVGYRFCDPERGAVVPQRAGASAARRLAVTFVRCSRWPRSPIWSRP